MEENYVKYHVHSHISNLTAGTGADSITKYIDYLTRAKEVGMTAFGISEHGSVMNWINKKNDIEKLGMKYIHANEVYLTQHIDKEAGLVRDNFHYMLLAKNYDGVLEINQLTSNSFDRNDGHFYYNPRITFDELKNTSDNILMTSACLASPLWKLHKKSLNDMSFSDMVSLNAMVDGVSAKHQLEDMLNWMEKNRHRMFFEIQYHNHPEQIEFNQMLERLSKELKIPLIAGTDTHSLNAQQAATRSIFLKSKGASYDNEDMFDLTFKTFPELVGMFKKQNALKSDAYMEAIHNTNVMANMVEEFQLDDSPKYPPMHKEPVKVFKEKINEGVVKRGINKFPPQKRKEYFDRIKEELDTYEKLDAVNYMLLQKHIIDWCHEQGIMQGYGRGSVNGSLIAYVLGITEMDSIKHKLNFFRFLNPERISLADIDIDFPPSRRQEVIDFVASLDFVEFAEIITFNTKALKGSIRLCGKGLGMDEILIDEIAKSVETFDGKDHVPNGYRTKYPELFLHVDTMNGVIESMGSHPSGFIVSPISLNDHVSTVYTKESKYRVTSVNMGELDGQNYVKLDILGLDNIELVNEACKLAGIERLTPDNIDTKDMAVWKSMTESTLGVFQMESDSASKYLKELFSDQTLQNIKDNVGEDVDYIEILSMANGAIRPSGDSYRALLAKGLPKDNGHGALNKSLRDTLGYLIYQEQIMRFLTDFCGHSGAESDTVRRGLSKKKGTEQYLPRVKQGFLKFMAEEHGESEEHALEILSSILQVIDDASRYGFSINHSSPYSFTGYICAWLRYYYPLEFLTVALNLENDESDKDKTMRIMNYAKQKRIKIRSIEFGKSKALYSLNRKENNIYKGLHSIKYVSAAVADQLYDLAQKKTYDEDDFAGLCADIFEHTNAQSNQMDILIRLDFFKKFGRKEVLLEVFHVMADTRKADIETHPEFAERTEITYKEVKDRKTKEIRVDEITKVHKRLVAYSTTHKDSTKAERVQNARDYEKAVRAKPPRKIEIHEQITFEIEKLGYPVSTWESLDPSVAIITEIENMKYTPKCHLYQLKSGKELVVKVNKKKFWNANDEQQLFIGDVLQVLEIEEQDGWQIIKEDDKKKWIRNPAIQEWHLLQAKLIRESPLRP